jgi:hypothetical protein
MTTPLANWSTLEIKNENPVCEQTEPIWLALSSKKSVVARDPLVEEWSMWRRLDE